MEDVVGVRFIDRVGGERALICWGRTFDSVDPEPLCAQVRRVLASQYPNLTLVEVCDDLGELVDFRYFHEAIISFAGATANLQLLSRKKFKEHFESLKDDEIFRKNYYLLGGKR